MDHKKSLRFYSNGTFLYNKFVRYSFFFFVFRFFRLKNIYTSTVVTSDTLYRVENIIDTVKEERFLLKKKTPTTIQIIIFIIAER